MAAIPEYQVKGKKQVIEFPEAASQTFKKGDYLTIDANGRCQQAAAAGADVAATSGNITGRILGRAEANATGVTGAFIPVLIAQPGTYFPLPVYHATAASAVPSTAHIGNKYELTNVNDTVDYYAIKIADTTDVKFKVVFMQPGPDGHDGVAATSAGPGIPTAASTVQYGIEYVEFMSEHCIFGGGA